MPQSAHDARRPCPGRTGILAFHSGRPPPPAAEELQKNTFRLDACFRLNLSGAPENAPDHVLEGEYLDEEGESQLDVLWIMETDDARQAFKGTAPPFGK